MYVTVLHGADNSSVPLLRMRHHKPFPSYTPVGRQTELIHLAVSVRPTPVERHLGSWLDGGMQKRTTEEIERLVKGYEESGLSRREYCEREGMPVTTFDYYRQRTTRKAAAKRRAAGLVKVKVEAAPVETPSVFFRLDAGQWPAGSRKRLEFQRGRPGATDSGLPRQCKPCPASGRRQRSIWARSRWDMRKGFEGLFGLVCDQFGHDPLSGHLPFCSPIARTPD